MKKRFLLKTMLLLCALVAGSSSVWAEDEEIATATFNGKNATYTAGWSTTGTGKNRTDCIVIGKDENITSPSFDLTDYSKVTITFTGRRYGTLTGSKATVDVSIGGDSQGTIDITNGSVGAVSGNINFVPTESMTAAVLVFTCTNATSAGSTHGAGIGSITIMGTPKNGGGEVTKVATPVFTPGGNTYNVVQSVTISCETEGATIHYTTNGDDPTESDATYTSAISVTKSGTVLKARAYKSGLTDSNIASESYTIKPNKPTIAAAGATVTITGDDGLEFYYTTDGTTTPTKSSTKYTGPFEPGADCTIKARAYDTYDNASDVTSGFKYKYMPLVPKSINSGYYEKVTNVSDLENGDAILIVNEGGNVALGPQSGNNCPGKTVTISAGVISNKGDAQKLILVKKTEKIDDVDTDVFYFYTGSAYLYAASSSSNYLKTEATPDDNNNARATIAISSGDARIDFTGTYSRNWLKYNSNNGSPLFSCYKSDDTSMGVVQIYKEVAHSETLAPAKTYTTLTSVYNLDFTSVSSNLKAYIATEVSGGNVLMTQVNKVPAGTGLVLKAETPGDAVNVPVFDGTGADDVSGNKMEGSATATTAVAENGGYILKEGKFQPALAGTLAAGKAYLAIAVSAPTLNLDFGETTGINAVNGSELKVNGEYYNLAGQRVANPTKGLYIVNGKKVIVK